MYQYFLQPPLLGVEMLPLAALLQALEKSTLKDSITAFQLLQLDEMCYKKK